MRASRLLAPALGLTFAAAAAVHFALALHTVVPHPQNMACEACHLAGESTDESNAHQLIASQERLCGECHEGALQVSHPTGFAAARALPTQFPVDWKGDLTCSTCHNVHGSHEGLLRIAAQGMAFCSACHGPEFFASMPDQGLSLIRSGHMDALTALTALDLDPFTRQCVGCHDDEADAPGLVVMITGSGLLRHGTGAINHPIGANYDQVARFGGYRESMNLDPVVLLPGGKVGCVSCHEGYALAHGKLVMKERALCLECHDY